MSYKWTLRSIALLFFWGATQTIAEDELFYIYHFVEPEAAVIVTGLSLDLGTLNLSNDVGLFIGIGNEEESFSTTGNGPVHIRNSTEDVSHVVGIGAGESIFNQHSGAITVENKYSGNDEWSSATGIAAANIIGEVKNDIHAKSWTKAIEAQWSSADSTGIIGDISGDVRGTISVQTFTGVATSSNGTSAGSLSFASGIWGNLAGDFTGTINAKATSGKATGASASAYTFAQGIAGATTGTVDGVITVDATAGTAEADGNTDNAEATATATGIGGMFFDQNENQKNVMGDVNGSISVAATGGKATSLNGIAYTSGTATGVDRGMKGDLLGSVSSTAKAGDASSLASYYYSSASAAHATAVAVGIGEYDSAQYLSEQNITMLGNVVGSISATAVGGTATTSNGNAHAYSDALGIAGKMSGDLSGSVEALATSGTAMGESANSEASARGISETLNGNMSGSIFATAKAGIAVSDNYGEANASAEAIGIGAPYFPSLSSVGGNITGSISAIATGGSATVSNGDAYANGYAAGIISSSITNNLFSGSIKASSYGGTVSSDEPYSTANATASAFGVKAYEVVINTFSGNIRADATAGIVTEGGTNRVSGALAAAIKADESLVLNTTGGSIEARIHAPEGFELGDLGAVQSGYYGEEVESRAYAILGGYQDDSIHLANVSLVGDIDLRTGNDQLKIFGDTSLHGGLFSTGIDSIMEVSFGSFGFERAISSSFAGDVNVSSSGGFSFMLKRGKTNDYLNIGGSLTIDEGAKLGLKGNADILGSTFDVIEVSGNLSGKFIQDTTSLFTFDFDTNATENVVAVTPTGIKLKDTSVGNSSVAAANTVGAFMRTASSQAGATRSHIGISQSRGALPSDGSSVSSGTENLKKGASGPEPESASEWKLFVRQVNDFGGRDSQGANVGYDWETHGFLVGVEKIIGQNLSCGLAGGAAWTSTDTDQNLGAGDVEMFMGSAYISYFVESWYSELGISYAGAETETERIDVLGDIHAGDYDSEFIGLWGEFGVDIPADTFFSLGQYCRGSYIYGTYEGYTDVGPTPMMVDASSSDNLVTEVGLRAMCDRICKNESDLHLELSIGWQYEWLDRTVAVNTTYLGQKQKSVTPEMDSASLVCGVGAEWTLEGGWSLGLKYEPTISENWKNHAVSGKLKFLF